MSVVSVTERKVNRFIMNGHIHVDKRILGNAYLATYLGYCKSLLCFDGWNPVGVR